MIFAYTPATGNNISYNAPTILSAAQAALAISGATTADFTGPSGHTFQITRTDEKLTLTEAATRFGQSATYEWEASGVAPTLVQLRLDPEIPFCRGCGDTDFDNGDGWVGLCGSCADIAELNGENDKLIEAGGPGCARPTI